MFVFLIIISKVKKKCVYSINLVVDMDGFFYFRIQVVKKSVIKYIESKIRYEMLLFKFFISVNCVLLILLNFFFFLGLLGVDKGWSEML